MFDIPVPKSGFSYNKEFETALAADEAGIPWQDFQALSGDEQSYYVARLRCKRQLEAVQAWVNRPRRR